MGSLEVALAVLLAVLCGPLRAAENVEALGPVDGHDLPPERIDRVRVGEAAPDFVLEDQRGERVRLSQFRGRRPVVLVFYRGKW